jgi:hypothetical protein
MPRPRKLTAEQETELRRAALMARAEGPRGYGSTRGRTGRSATEQLVDPARERWSVALTPRGMQKLLGRLGLEYRAAAQGGRWREPGR